MALTGTASVLGLTWANSHAAIPGSPSAEEITQWTQHAQDLIDHLVANVLVSTSDTISNCTGIISPAGACSGVGLGTGTGRIS